MKSIDDILRKAKSEVPELSERFSTNVLLKIKEQELTILPQKIIRSQINWFSLIIGIGLLMIALMITNNAIFEIQMSGSLELLSFGTQYLSDFTKYLPLDIIIPSLFITAISAWLLVRSRMIKRGVTLVVAGSFLVTTIGGSALAATSLNGKIQASIIKEKTNNKNPFFIFFIKYQKEEPPLLQCKPFCIVTINYITKPMGVAGYQLAEDKKELPKELKPLEDLKKLILILLMENQQL